MSTNKQVIKSQTTENRSVLVLEQDVQAFLCFKSSRRTGHDNNGAQYIMNN